MNQSIAILCSLALCLWGYQTGLGLVAISMAIVLEARNMMRHRWKISWNYFQFIHVLAAFIWLLSIFWIPSYSPTPIPYSASLHILKCLPLGLFPLVLAQTYSTNFCSFYRDRGCSRPVYGSINNINLYYPYFGICLLAASATGGNPAFFLALTTGLVAGFLGTLRSRRYGPGIFGGLMALALFISIFSSHELSQLQAKLNDSPFLRNLAQHLSSPFAKDDKNSNHGPLANDALRKAAESSEPQAHPILQRELQPAPRSEAASVPPSTSTPISSGANSQAEPTKTQAELGTPSAQDNPSAPQVSQPVQGNPSAPQVSQTVQGNDSTPSSNQAVPTPSATPTSQTLPNIAQTISSQEQAAVGRPPQALGGDRNNSAPIGSGQGGIPNRAGTEPAPQTATAQRIQPSGTAIVQVPGGDADPLNSSTQIGNRGSLQLSDAVVFRVATHADPQLNRRIPTFPLYIREATYNQYRSGQWQAVQSQFVSQTAQTNRQRWILGAPTPNTASVRISANFPQQEGVLKLPIGTSAIDQLTAEAIQANQYGTVAVKRPSGAATYTVQFDPTQSLDSPPNQADMDLPPTEKPTMQNIIQSLALQGKSDSEIVTAIAAFFRAGFTYSLTLPEPQGNTAPLANFLLNHRSGHCEYFASATSLLLRAAGIPSRYAVGYLVQEYSPTEQQYLVRARNAHAWTLAYVNGAWVEIDTTPSDQQPHQELVDSIPDGKLSRQDPLDSTSEKGQPQIHITDTTHSTHTTLNHPQQGQPVHGVQDTTAKQWSALVQAIQTLPNSSAKLRSFLSANLPKHLDPFSWSGAMIVLGLTIIICSLFFAWKMLTQQHRALYSKRLKYSRMQSSQPFLTDGLDSEFYILEQRLGEWGLARRSSETVKQWILRLEQKIPASRMNRLHQIIDLHYRYRFDPHGITAEDRHQLKSMIQSWLMETAI